MHTKSPKSQSAPRIRVTETNGVRVDAAVSIAQVREVIEEALSHCDRAWVGTFANPSTVASAAKDLSIAGMMKRFDLVLPDGIGLVAAMRVIHRCPAMRFSFDTTSLAPIVFSLAEQRNLSVAFVGGRPGVADDAARIIQSSFPKMKIAGTMHGYEPIDDLARDIAALNPRIVIVGMGLPAQERFLLALVDKGWTGVGFTCGGYLDQTAIAGLNYYPWVFNRLNIRFLYRFIREPQRLWRRYLIQYPFFVALTARTLIWRR